MLGWAAERAWACREARSSVLFRLVREEQGGFWHMPTTCPHYLIHSLGLTSPSLHLPPPSPSHTSSARDLLEELMDDEEEFIQLNLSSRPKREERRKQRERERLEREIEQELAGGCLPACCVGGWGWLPAVWVVVGAFLLCG